MELSCGHGNRLDFCLELSEPIADQEDLALLDHARTSNFVLDGVLPLQQAQNFQDGLLGAVPSQDRRMS